MKLNNILTILAAVLFFSCALEEPDGLAETEDFPLRLQIDEEGADLADAEDYSVEISFADYIGDLPANEITLNYALSGEGDFSNVAIDEIFYEYETDDCKFIREVNFDGSTMTIPVDPDMGTVPEEIEIVVALNLAGDEAADGGFELEITDISSPANVVMNDANTFEYGILDNDLAGAWVYEVSEDQFDAFKAVFGSVSSDLADLSYAEITGEIVLEFEFEEMKIEIELEETEEVSECEDGETETEIENIVIEIEADYDAEDGELELEGSYFDDGEEIDFILAAVYELLPDDQVRLTFESIVGEDNFEEGEELFTGATSVTITKD